MPEFNGIAGGVSGEFFGGRLRERKEDVTTDFAD
jgi:hypothetical protein